MADALLAGPDDDAAAALVAARLALAGRIAADLRREHALAALLVAGSTALGRCTAASDLDLIALVPGAYAGPPVTSIRADGVQLDIEWLSLGDALARTAGDGWVWELRAAARLGGAIGIDDPGGLAARLRTRAAAMRPDPARYEAQLARVYTGLIALGEGGGSPEARAEAFRGVLDNVAMLLLLASPCRYQKAKWTLADLDEIGWGALGNAICHGYGIDRSGAAPVLAAAGALVDGVLAHVGAPDHRTLIGMGHVPDGLGESYVARALGDAADLAAAGRPVEAHYVARFAVRLAAGLLAVPDDSGVAGAFARIPGLASRYAALFARGDGSPSQAALEVALDAADACAAAFEAEPAGAAA